LRVSLSGIVGADDVILIRDLGRAVHGVEHDFARFGKKTFALAQAHMVQGTMELEVTSGGTADDDCCQIGRRGHNDAVSVACETLTYVLGITKIIPMPHNSLSLKYLCSSFLKDIYPNLFLRAKCCPKVSDETGGHKQRR
jgi:hypothetical protein